MRHNDEARISKRRWMTAAARLCLATASLLLSATASFVLAVVVPQEESGELHRLAVSDPALHPTIDLATIDAAGDELDLGVRAAWSDFTGRQRQPEDWTAQIDRRSGLVEIAEGAGVPWVPGYGNQLQLADVASHLRGRPDLDAGALESIARSFLPKVAPLLGSDAYELRLDRAASGRYSDYLWFVEFEVWAGGLEIEGARVFFRVNNGNLIQFGAEKVPAPGTPVPEARISRDSARASLERYAGNASGRDWLVDKGSLLLLPVAADQARTDYAFGQGYELLPVWELSFRRGDEHPTWRARVDAVTGEIVDFRDVNRYSQVTGGYWPVAWKVGGTTVNQVSTGWPFTSVNPLGATSNTSGLYTWDSNPQTAYHTGPYVNIADSCTGTAGTASSDGAGNIDFGTFNPSGPTDPGDCTNALGIGDNTPAARQQYWHVNKIKEKARSYFPANTWLQQQLTVNVNINLTCNAFWNGSTLNFYRSGGSCYNLGANAGVSMHEWGHGMDSNDGNGSSIDNGTGETYGDFSGALQTLNSCLGNGIFTSGVCGGYGNPCVAGGCDGIRDIDWGRHAGNAPPTVSNFIQPTPTGVTTGSCSLNPGEIGCCPSDGGGNYNGPCGDGAPQPDDKEGHCESLVSSSALWDLAAADLQTGCTNRNGTYPDYGCPTPTGPGGPYNSAGAWGTVDRLWYLSRPTANQAFTCYRTSPAWTSDGCNSGSNWKTFRAIDDDDGNLANGTPHACQIAAAFNRHGLGNTAGSSCAADVTTCFRACPQPTAPALNPATAGNNQVTLDWTPDPAPDVIDVFRNEVGCDSGFAKIAEDVSGTFFVDNSVANGTTYYYQVLRHPIGNESCASPPSTCVSGTPAAGPSAKYVSDSATLASVPADNDGDGFVDNCETGRIQVGIVNDGLGALSGVRFTVTSPDPEVSFATLMPVVVGGLAVSALTTGSFDFDLDGAACGQTLNFDVAVTADEMSGSNLDSFSHGPVEQDLTPAASSTDDFETSGDGWSFVAGYARENVTADSGVWSVHSSSGTDDQLDVALSPIFRRGAGATQVVIAERHDIEAPYWDRANVHAIRLSDASHTLLTPTGRTYTTGTWNDVGHVGTEDGWAGTDLSWGDAAFDLSGLVAGESYRLEINYNTDGAVTGTGHWFDNVRWTNVSFHVCDGESDLCVPCTPPNAPTGLSATASAANQITLAWNAVAPAPSQYRIYRATTPGGPYAPAGTVGGSTLTFDDTGLAPGVTYYYVVRAFEICESADSNEASDTAFGDCTTPPTFGGLSSVTPISAGGSCGLRLEWSAGTSGCNSAPVVYNVYRSTVSGFTPGPANLLQSCVTNAFHDDTSATSGTTYYYVVQAEDAALGGGGECRDGNVDGNSSEISGAVGGSGTTVVFEDDFDGSQSPGDLWAFGTFGNPYTSGSCATQTFVTDWYRPETGFCSGNTAASNNQAASPAYRIHNNGALILGIPPSGGPPFTDGGVLLPASATSITLTFLHDFDFEGPDWDGGRVMISVDNWPTFTALTPVGGYPGTVRNTTTYCHPWPGQPAYIGDSGSCGGATFDLTAYSGSRVWIAWNHGADNFNTADDGWMIDDVQIEAVTPSACSPAPGAVRFLTATASDGRNDLEWMNPGSGGYGSTMIRWSTAGYPADPAGGTLLVDQDDGLGGKGTAVHGGLANDTTYYYSAWVDNGAGEYSARRTVSARPFDTSGNVQWSYSTGASALAPPGIGSVYSVANDRVLHSMTVGASGTGGGTWPGAWTPMAMNGPAQSRPPIVPVAVGGATKIALLGSQDHRVYAVNADTGQAVWSSPDLGAMVQGAPAGIYTAFGGAYDLILAGTRNSSASSEFFGLNLANGGIAWSFTNTAAQAGDDSAIGIISSNPAVDWATTRVYFASRRHPTGSSGTVWCLSFTDTSVTLVPGWPRDLGDVDGSPILHGGRLYVGNNAGEIHALDPTTGLDLWTLPFDAGDGPVKGYVWPRFGTSELLFATTNRLWSITDGGAAATLNPNWPETTIPNPSIPLVFPVAGTPHLWVGSSDGRLYQLDLSAADPPASKTWVTLGDGSATVGSPALDAPGGIAYVGTEEGRLYQVTLPLP